MRIHGVCIDSLRVCPGGTFEPDAFNCRFQCKHFTHQYLVPGPRENLGQNLDRRSDL